MSKKIFSGVQPTGNLHLGNYLGARGWPNVEWDTNATFGSNPNNLTTLAVEIAISAICSDVASIYGKKSQNC